MTRNPKWWGTPPLLDSITYLVLDDAARIPALQNNTIDATGLATLDELTIARRTPGSRSGAHREQLVPLHVQRRTGIDPRPTRSFGSRSPRASTDKPSPTSPSAGWPTIPATLNNHVYVAGQEGYQDNSAVVAYDPEKAKQELDALGWTLNGQFREKDGQQLVIRDVMYDSLTTRQYRPDRAEQPRPDRGQARSGHGAGGRLLHRLRHRRQLRHRPVRLGGRRRYRCRCLTQIYTTGAESNFGKISSPEIDAKTEETLDELDPDKARALANEFDMLLCDEGFSLPLFQSPGNVAVRSNVANFGAFGLAIWTTPRSAS